VAAKDDFASIKNTSRDDILAAHRVPPQLLGMVPSNAGGFGDVEKAKRVFMENEVAPIQTKMLGLNAALGIEVFRFVKSDSNNTI
jgi:capsid portal protein